ncbi:MAG: NADH-quinone oxidoreductase subunit C [Planctomycetota bacterium]
MHAEAYKTLQDALGDAIEEVVTEGTQPFARVRADSIVEAAKTLREKCGADMLHLVTGTDFKDRFEVAYHFAGIEKGASDFFCLKVTLSHDDPVLPTLAHDWPSADWFERETWDLVGIRFEGHPHHYRILLPEDWEGHPLRKDYEFPTTYHGIDCTK